MEPSAGSRQSVRLSIPALKKYITLVTERGIRLTANGGRVDKPLSICYYGSYDRNRSRNRNLIQGLMANGIKVVECHADVWGDIQDKSQVKHLGRYFLRYLKIFLLPFRYFFIPKHEVVMVGYWGLPDLFLIAIPARLRRATLCYDTYLSLYGLLVEDRQFVKAGSLAGKLVWLLEKMACHLPHSILLDTKAHIRYFQELYGISEKKFLCSYVGAEGKYFFPGTHPKSGKQGCRILFYGHFIPLQGVEFILRAAKLLESSPIEFILIGNGQTYAKDRSLSEELGIRGIRWIPYVPYDKLVEKIHECDIGLGIFGMSRKASLVIPNKVFQMAAGKIAIITADTPAIKELFTNGKDCVLVPPGNPDRLADAIGQLASNEGLRTQIAEQGYALYRERASTQGIGLRLAHDLSALRNNKSAGIFQP